MRGKNDHLPSGARTDEALLGHITTIHRASRGYTVRRASRLNCGISIIYAVRKGVLLGSCGRRTWLASGVAKSGD